MVNRRHRRHWKAGAVYSTAELQQIERHGFIMRRHYQRLRRQEQENAERNRAAAVRDPRRRGLSWYKRLFSRMYQKHEAGRTQAAPARTSLLSALKAMLRRRPAAEQVTA